MGHRGGHQNKGHTNTSGTPIQETEKQWTHQHKNLQNLQKFKTPVYVLGRIFEKAHKIIQNPMIKGAGGVFIEILSKLIL